MYNASSVFEKTPYNEYSLSFPKHTRSSNLFVFYLYRILIFKKIFRHGIIHRQTNISKTLTAPKEPPSFSFDMFQLQLYTIIQDI